MLDLLKKGQGLGSVEYGMGVVGFLCRPEKLDCLHLTSRLIEGRKASELSFHSFFFLIFFLALETQFMLTSNYLLKICNSRLCFLFADQKPPEPMNIRNGPFRGEAGQVHRREIQ